MWLGSTAPNVTPYLFAASADRRVGLKNLNFFFDGFFRNENVGGGLNHRISLGFISHTSGIRQFSRFESRGGRPSRPHGLFVSCSEPTAWMGLCDSGL